MKYLSRIKRAYIAGFLDGDGSIYIRLKPNSDYRFGYQVSPNIVFYQSLKNLSFLAKIKRIIEEGYIRKRNDGVAEYVLGDKASMVSLIEQILPYLILKKKQAKLFLKILEKKEMIKSKKDFLKLAELIDNLEKLNYSKKRIITSRVVSNNFKKL